MADADFLVTGAERQRLGRFGGQIALDLRSLVVADEGHGVDGQPAGADQAGRMERRQARRQQGDRLGIARVQDAGATGQPLATFQRQARDIGIGPDNMKRWLKTGKCSFLPEEREWMARLKNWGLVDSFRHLNPDVTDRFSWFDYRSRGFEDEPKRGLRIDLILIGEALKSAATAAAIDREPRRWERPSDHTPVTLELDI